MSLFLKFAPALSLILHPSVQFSHQVRLESTCGDSAIGSPICD